MPLSDIAIRTSKAPSSATLKLSDGGGLQLWITAKGSKLWHLAYKFDGKQKKLSLGSYPTITLAAARHLSRSALFVNAYEDALREAGWMLCTLQHDTLLQRLYLMKDQPNDA